MARFGVSVGENVGALDCLVRVSEDVVDDEDGGGGVGGAGSVLGGGVSWVVDGAEVEVGEEAGTDSIWCH